MNDPHQLIGQKVDHYLVSRFIGQGGMAAVYQARDESLDRDVVLKVMLTAIAQDDNLRRRFAREARTTANLDHPHIVPVYTTGFLPTGEPYIALQYMKDGSLSDRLQQLAKEGQWVSTIYALALVRQVADALNTAHKAQIIHRDLKPSNILLRPDGMPVISDLGIAAVKMETTHLTQTGGFIGTPNYMSPEQASSQIIDGRSDLYSLGVILFELLSGQLPFDAESPWAMIHHHIYEQPTPLIKIRPNLTLQTYRIVETCLQKDPNNRYPDAAALVAALDKALAAEDKNPHISVGSQPLPLIQGYFHKPQTRAPIPDLAGPSPKRQWWLAGFIILLFSGLAAFALLRPDPDLSVALPLIVDATTATPTITQTPELPTPLLPTSTLRPSPTHTPTPPLAPAASSATLPPTNIPITDSTTIPQSEGVIAYACGPTGNQQIHLSDPDGRNQHLLPNQPANSNVPAFSPDGSEIAYRSNSGGDWQIFVSHVDGSNRRQITNGPGENFEAVWSPDSSRFVFTSNRTGSLQLFLMYTDGTTQLQLTDTITGARNDDPSWSVQNQIAYESNSDGSHKIYLITPEGGPPRELITIGRSTTTPAWSPDGQLLAFESSSEVDNWQIWTATDEGTNLKPITDKGTRNLRPVWSPNGTHLAFHSNYQQTGELFFDIWTINLATSDLIRLTTRGDCFNPAWGRTTAAVESPPTDCPLAVGMTVTAGNNARLWPTPDATIGSSFLDITPGIFLQIIGGPTWGRILRDQDTSGWWWQIQMPAGGANGWVWQERLQECS